MIDPVGKWLLSNLMPFFRRLEESPVSTRLILMITAACLGTAAVFAAEDEIVGFGLFVFGYGFAMLTGSTVEASVAKVHRYVARYGIEGCDYQAEKDVVPCGEMPVVIKRCRRHQFWLPDEVAK